MVARVHPAIMSEVADSTALTVSQTPSPIQVTREGEQGDGTGCVQSIKRENGSRETVPRLPSRSVVSTSSLKSSKKEKELRSASEPQPKSSSSSAPSSFSGTSAEEVVLSSAAGPTNTLASAPTSSPSGSAYTPAMEPLKEGTDSPPIADVMPPPSTPEQAKWSRIEILEKTGSRLPRSVKARPRSAILFDRKEQRPGGPVGGSKICGNHRSPESSDDVPCSSNGRGVGNENVSDQVAGSSQEIATSKMGLLQLGKASMNLKGINESGSLGEDSELCVDEKDRPEEAVDHNATAQGESRKIETEVSASGGGMDPSGTNLRKRGSTASNPELESHEKKETKEATEGNRGRRIKSKLARSWIRKSSGSPKQFRSRSPLGSLIGGASNDGQGKDRESEGREKGDKSTHGEPRKRSDERSSLNSSKIIERSEGKTSLYIDDGGEELSQDSTGSRLARGVATSKKHLSKLLSKSDRHNNSTRQETEKRETREKPVPWGIQQPRSRRIVSEQVRPAMIGEGRSTLLSATASLEGGKRKSLCAEDIPTRKPG